MHRTPPDVGKVYGRPPDDPMEDLDVNVAFWGIFMNATLKAAVHLGNDHDVNLRHVKNSFWSSAGQLFGETEKLISGQRETDGISLINSEDLRWISTSVLHSRAYQYANAKVYVFSDSVLCLGKMGPNPVESWKNQIQWYSETNYFSELNRFDGKAMEFEWKIFPGFTTAGILNEIQKTTGELQCDPANFKGRNIFMSMFNDIVWEAKGNEKLCEHHSKRVEEYARRFPLVFLWAWFRKEMVCHLQLQTKRILGSDCGEDAGEFQRSGHPIFRCTSALERGHLKSKGGGRTTIHFTASDDNVQLILKMVISVNQLSLNGAVADLIKELPVDQRAPGKPVALDQMEQEILTQPPLAEVQADDAETYCKIASKDLKN